MPLIDAVECIITCSKCGNKTGGFGIDDYSLAEEAFKEGWHETSSGAE